MGIKRRLRTDNYAACCKQDKQPGHVDVPFGHKIEIPARMRGCRRCLALNLPHLRHTTATCEEGRQQQEQEQHQQQQHQQGDGNDSNIQIYMAAGHAEIMPSNWYQQPMQQQQQHQQHQQHQQRLKLQQLQREQQMLLLGCSGFLNLQQALHCSDNLCAMCKVKCCWV